MPHEQLPPNLQSFGPVYGLPPSEPAPANNARLSTLNSVLAHQPQVLQHQPQSNVDNNGIPSGLLNSFLRQQPQSATLGQQQHPQPQPGLFISIRTIFDENYLFAAAQPSYATNIVAPQPYGGIPQQQHPLLSAAPQQQVQPTGRSIANIQGQPRLTQSQPTPYNAIADLPPPPVINKESLTDEDIRLIEEHNRKVRLFLQQRQSELAAEQENAKRQQAAKAAAAAAETERLRRLKAEQETAAREFAEQERVRRIKAEQEAAQRAAAEAERVRRIKAEQEAAQRAAAEAEQVRRMKAEQEAAQRAAIEAERVRRLKAAEQERARRIKAEQEAAARAAAEAENLRRLQAEHQRAQHYRAEQEAAARAAAEQEQLKKIREEQETTARIAAEQERIRRLKAEQEAATRAALEQERYRQLRAQQEAAARLAEQERYRIDRVRGEPHLQSGAAQAQANPASNQQLGAIRVRYQGGNLHMFSGNNVTLSSSQQPTLAYQPEANLAADDGQYYGNNDPNTRSNIAAANSGGQSGQAHLIDAARYRAEKEALAEQERLLRFQTSQQVLAQQQAAEQARLRQLQDEEAAKAEAERVAREAQERQIIRAREEQNRLIQAARTAATRPEMTAGVNYSPYGEEAEIQLERTTQAPASQSYGSLNNIRRPEMARNNYQGSYQPEQPALINADYVRRTAQPQSSSSNVLGQQLGNSYVNQTSASLRSNRVISSLPSNPVPPNAQRSPTNDVTTTDSATTTPSNYKPAKISLQELPPDLDADGIPGVAGKDYPTLTAIPKTSFSCARQPLNGYYADTGKQTLDLFDF